MFRVGDWLAGLALLVLVFVAGPVAAAPLEAYGRLPFVEDAELSPSGEMIAFALTREDARIILIRKVATGEVVATLNAGDQKIRDLQWAGEDYLLITASQTTRIMEMAGPSREYFLTTVFSLKTGKQRNLMERAAPAMNVVIGPLYVRTIDGDTYVIAEGVHFADINRGRDSLFRIRLRDGKTWVHREGHRDTDDWVVGMDGEPIAETEYEDVKGVWTLRIRKGKSLDVVTTDVLQLSRPSLAGLGRDGASALLILNHGSDGGSIDAREYPVDGSPSRDFVLPDYDELIHDPVTGALIGSVALVGDDLKYSFLDPKTAATWSAVTKAYPGQKVRLASWSDNRRKLVAQVENPEYGPSYVLIDLDQKRSDEIGNLYPDLKREDVNEVRPIRYAAADGLQITGYLTLPRGRTDRKLPLIVLPHGGPASRDEPGFDWWSQALASRGYAVFQPNFRGSDGFGDDFLAAGYGEWGRKMQTDLSDGVRYLAAQGFIDPAKVCIVGASYGGYAALAGATLDTGVYRCAASVSGVSDLPRFLNARYRDANHRETDGLRYWSRFLGVEGRKDPDLNAISPVRLVDKVTIPILLVHGKDDTVVRYDQSQVMYDALKKAGKPVELVTLRDEDHWMSRAPTRLQMLEAVVAFLETNNPPD